MGARTPITASCTRPGPASIRPASSRANRTRPAAPTSCSRSRRTAARPGSSSSRRCRSPDSSVSAIQDPVDESGQGAPARARVPGPSRTSRSDRKGTSMSPTSAAATSPSSTRPMTAGASRLPTTTPARDSRSARDSRLSRTVTGCPRTSSGPMRSGTSSPTRPGRGPCMPPRRSSVLDALRQHHRSGRHRLRPLHRLRPDLADSRSWSARTPRPILNDDNDGQPATGSPDDVISGQALPRLAVDAQGNIAVIWYDTRRDPANHLLDVFGTVSTDGGQTFSPNFRVTDQSFDADAGKFTDAIGPDRLLPRRLPRPVRRQRHGLRRLDRHPQRQPGRLLHPLPHQPGPRAAQRSVRAQRHPVRRRPTWARSRATICPSWRSPPATTTGSGSQAAATGQPDRHGDAVRPAARPASRALGRERDDAAGERDRP